MRLSPLLCPNCGHQQLDQLSSDNDGAVYGCRRCRRLWNITPYSGTYNYFVPPEPTPLLDLMSVDEIVAELEGKKGGSA